MSKVTKIEVLEKNLDTYTLVCESNDTEMAKAYARKYGYCVTVNGYFIKL